MESLTRFALRHRWPVVAVWLVVLLAAGWASSGLSDLLTNRFTLPGSDTAKAETILEDHFGQKSTGAFTVVARSDGPAARIVPEVRRAAERASDELPTSRVAGVAPMADDVVVATIVSEFEPADAKGHTDAMRQAIGSIDGAEVWLTG